MSLSNSLGLLGRKVGMTRLFTDDGDSVPVTVVDVSDNRVAQVKTQATRWLRCVAVDVRQAPRLTCTKPAAGHLAKAGVEAGEIFKNSVSPQRSPRNTPQVPLCQLPLFAAGQKVDVQGTLHW
jgi:large subunit ribosomal protein L3